MIAKVIATAETRTLAIARLAAALREFEIAGIQTNRAFLIAILESDAFRDGAIDTAFLDREGAKFAAALPADVPTKSAVSNLPSAIDYDPWSGAGIAAARAQATPSRTRASSAATDLTAPMPATVIKVNVKAGDAVKKGDILIVLEAMKMELPLRALGDGIVADVRCREGELVQADAPLVAFA